MNRDLFFILALSFIKAIAPYVLAFWLAGAQGFVLYFVFDWALNIAARMHLHSIRKQILREMEHGIHLPHESV